MQKINIIMGKILDKESLIKDYQEGMTWDNLCKKYNCTLKPIHSLLKKRRIQKTRVQGNSWDKEKRELFKRMYLSNCTYEEMYKALDCKGGTLTYWVHKLNLPMRGSGRNNNYPNKFLENSIESNYWLGYIFADGHISYNKDKRRFCVELCSEKEYVVQKFKEWYNNLPKIYKRNYTLKDGTTKTMYRASLHDKHLAEWFHDNLNIDNVKHHNLNPKIELNWDIIRGFFDGDGTSAKGCWVLKSCSKKWLRRIQKFLESYNIKSTLKLSYLDCYGLSIYDKKNIIKVASLMYSNNYFCHTYKYKLLEPYISNDVMKTE